MTTFDDGLDAIKKAAEFAQSQGIDHMVTLDRHQNKFFVWSGTEPATGEFIERVRFDVHPEL